MSNAVNLNPLTGTSGYHDTGVGGRSKATAQSSHDVVLNNLKSNQKEKENVHSSAGSTVITTSATKATNLAVAANLNELLKNDLRHRSCILITAIKIFMYVYNISFG